MKGAYRFTINAKLSPLNFISHIAFKLSTKMACKRVLIVLNAFPKEL